MEWLMFLALSAVVALILNFVQPLIAANTAVQGVTSKLGSFANIAVLTTGVFVALLAGAWIMSKVSRVDIPTA